MNKYEALMVFFSGPELTKEIIKDLQSTSFSQVYEKSELSNIMSGRSSLFDRLEIMNGVLWAAIDGIGDDISEIVDYYHGKTLRYPNSSFMVVGKRYDDDIIDPILEVILNSGFTKENDPIDIL